MADNDETQVPLVSSSAQEEELTSNQETQNKQNDDAISTSKENNNTNENKNENDDEPLIKTNDKLEPAVAIGNTNITAVSLSSMSSLKSDEEDTIHNTKNKNTIASASTTEIQLQNAIALSPKSEDINKDTNESKNDKDDSNDDEPHITGIGDSNNIKNKKDDKSDDTNILLSATNDINNDSNDEKELKEDSKFKLLEDEILKLKEKISTIKANPTNFFEKYFEKSISKLGNRQKRQREQQRERSKNTELNIKQQKLLRGHFGKVYCIDWTNDSEEIVSCSQDSKILIWNVMTTHKRVAIPLMTAWTMTCTWSNSSEMIACGGLDNTISIYRIKRDTAGWESKRPYIELTDHNGYISDIKFIDDNHLVSSSGDGSAILYDIEKEYGIAKFEHEGDVMSISIHKDKNLLLTGSTDGTAKIWDLRMATQNGYNKNHSDVNSNNNNITTEGPTGGGGNDTDALITTDDNKQNDISIAGNSDTDDNAIYTVSSMHSFGSRPASNASYSSDVNSVSWFPDGSAFVIGCDDSHCKLFDIRTNSQLVSYHDPENTCNVTDIDISKSGKYVYATYDNDPWCAVWETATGDKKQTIVHPSRPACLRVAPNGYSFATGCWDNKIRIWAP